ncbi:4Fe-4S dicluster domain-containing protein [Gemmatimonadota bacterium]
MDRRFFLKTVNLAAGAALVGKCAQAAEPQAGGTVIEQIGVLVDTTVCEGCQSCEYICAETNGLPEPDVDDSAFDSERKTSETQWTLVNRFQTSKGEVYAKRQCMHCDQPACASACLTKAMSKTPRGPVVWNSDKCMGCRFCMISCPYDMPKFEYNSPVPKLQKCRLCLDRLQEGEQPACAENCPAEALTFGRKTDLLDIARARIANEPDKYVHHIYGEHEAGGTGWLYLASVPFEELGFRKDIGTKPYPELTKEFLYGVPVVITLLPPFLLALSNATRKDNQKTEGDH